MKETVLPYGLKKTLPQLLCFLVILLTASNAYAVCSSPAGTEGEVIYNSAYEVLQYCDDTDWVAVSSSQGEGSSGTVGTVSVPNLVGYWRMDNYAATINDDSGTGNDATPSATFTEVGGYLNGGLDLDAADNDEFTVSPSASINNIGAKTVCAWIYPESFSNPRNKIFDKTAADGSSGWYMYLQYSDATTAYIGFRTNGADWRYISSPSIQLNTWQHVCATWDGDTSGNTGLIMYLNGSTSGSGAGGTSSGTFDDTAYDLTIGGDSGSSSFNFDGYIDEACLFNDVLDASQIADVYNYGCDMTGSKIHPADRCTDRGAVTYSNAGQTPVYCDGFSWRPMADSPGAGGSPLCGAETNCTLGMFSLCTGTTLDSAAIGSIPACQTQCETWAGTYGNQCCEYAAGGTCSFKDGSPTGAGFGNFSGMCAEKGVVAIEGDGVNCIYFDDGPDDQLRSICTSATTSGEQYCTDNALTDGTVCIYGNGSTVFYNITGPGGNSSGSGTDGFSGTGTGFWFQIYIGNGTGDADGAWCTGGFDLTCSGPAGNRGDIIYNDDHNVLQYCDGANWRAIGKKQ